MPDRPLRCVTISDFNLATFDALLANDEGTPRVDVVSTDFGQVHTLLLDAGAECWTDRPEIAVLWTRPETAAPSFAALRDFGVATTAEALTEVEAYADLVEAAAARVETTFLPTWTIPADERGLGFIDLAPDGVRGTLDRMNLALVERFATRTDVHVLDARSWMARVGPTAVSRKLWHMAKVPFTNAVFELAVAEVKAALRGLAGGARKLVIVDLDDTLWGGVVGDDGWERLRLGGHDPVGEAYVDFQRGLKALTNRGILLGIASKNTEAVALEAIREHPEMVLSLDDFAGWRINWDDKAANIVDLTAELNLGLDSVVFIDDSDFERGRVADALPEVLVPRWPDDPMTYRRRLAALDCFDAPAVSDEDRARAGMYRAEKERRATRGIVSPEEWLKTLDLVVRVEPLDASTLPRATQLLNKTNQMNLRTRRLTETELSKWASGESRRVHAFRVSDRFGDSGLTGLVSVDVANGRAEVSDFVMSCRVMGRGIEEAMFAVAVATSRELGATRLVAEYSPTPRNGPCLQFLQRSGLAVGSNGTFSWDPEDPYAVPEHIVLESGPKAEAERE